MQPEVGGALAKGAFAQARQVAAAWIGRVRVRPPQASVRDVACEVLLREGLDLLAGLEEAERASRIEALVASQDATSGLFVDPVGIPTLEVTAWALQALGALDVEPRHPVFAGASAAGVDAREGWQDPWPVARTLAARLLALVWSAEHEGRAEARREVHAVLDALDVIRDRRTGLLGTSQGAPIGEALAAAGLLVPFYEYVARPWTGAGQALDLALAQAQSGQRYANAHQELAGVSLAACLSALYEYRREDVRRMAAEVANEILSRPPIPDGAEDLAQSDGGARERLLSSVCLAVIEEVVSGATPWKFTRLPVAGANRGRRRNEAELSTLAGWLRPEPANWSREASVPSPAVSVVVPCHDLGLYLWEALGSALAQDDVDLEVVVVDDGSTDLVTAMVLERLQSPRIRVLKQTCRGLAEARNRGVAEARASYVCCLDADDRLRPGFLARAVGILDQEPDVGAVSGAAWRFDGDDRVFRGDSVKLPELLVENGIAQTSMFRREAWRQVGGYYAGFSVSGIEDWDFWIRIVERGFAVRAIPDVVMDYRIRPRSMSSAMYEPATWGRLTGELAQRHEQLYRIYYREITEQRSRVIAEMWGWQRELARGKDWLAAQRDGWQCRYEAVAREFEGLRSWSQQLELDAQQVRDQLAASQRQLDEAALTKEAQRRWIDELERGQAWMEEQRRNLILDVQGKDGLIGEMRAWIAELEKGNAWLVTQRGLSAAGAERNAAYVAELRSWIDELERGKAWLEGERETWRGKCEELARELIECRAALTASRSDAVSEGEAEAPPDLGKSSGGERA